MTWEETVTVYDELVAKSENFERKGKTVPYTSANGYMFSMVNKEGEIGMRLPKALQEEFKEKYSTTGFKSHGANMKDYVLIPESLWGDLDLLAGYLEMSYEYVMSLKPK